MLITQPDHSYGISLSLWDQSLSTFANIWKLVSEPSKPLRSSEGKGYSDFWAGVIKWVGLYSATF
jgi:hypothetical protein